MKKLTTPEKVSAEILELAKRGYALLEKFGRKEEASPYKHAGEYQRWYSASISAVRFLAPDRIAEFLRLYEPAPTRRTMNVGNYVISDYLRGLVYPTGTAEDGRGRVLSLLYNQVTIISSLSERVLLSIHNLEGQLDSDLRSDELSTAEALLKVNFRAAGALAGVILEGHLQKVAERHSVSLKKKKPTLADLNDPLKEAAVYDLVSWRKVQTYADIRNLCSHKKAENPTEAQVRELIQGVRWALSHIA